METQSRTATTRLAAAVELIKTMGLVAAFSLIPRIVLCQPVTIPSESMQPTLLVGDYLLISKYPYGWSRHSVPLSPPLAKGRIAGHAPAAGDIVVFKQPSDARTDIIKRVIGLPGDRIQVVGGVVRINGRPIRRETLPPELEDGPFGRPVGVGRYRETLPNGARFETLAYGPDTAGANTGVYLVPAGCYFVMGDNRDNSADSRFDPGQAPAGQSSCPWNAELDRYLPGRGMGFIPADNLVGRAEMVVFSAAPGASLLRPWTLIDAVRWGRSFHSLRAAG
jgi:signal peptidase I